MYLGRNVINCGNSTATPPSTRPPQAPGEDQSPQAPINLPTTQLLNCLNHPTTPTTQVAPRIMTWKQYGDAAINLARRKLLGEINLPEYSPDFTQCVDHLVIHAGGCDSVG